MCASFVVSDDDDAHACYEKMESTGTAEYIFVELMIVRQL